MNTETLASPFPPASRSAARQSPLTCAPAAVAAPGAPLAAGGRTGGRNPGVMIGVSFLTGFGALWITSGCLAAYGLQWPLLLAIAGVAAMLPAAAWLLTFRGARPDAVPLPKDELDRIQRVFRNVNIIQWAAIVGVIVVLNLAQLAHWIPPAIMFVVGIHFFPLARLFHWQGHIISGGAVTLWALTYPLLLAQGPLNPLGPSVTGAILWASAAAMIVGARRQGKASA